jgi:hypothetical protein
MDNPTTNLDQGNTTNTNESGNNSSTPSTNDWPTVLPSTDDLMKKGQDTEKIQKR